MSLVDAAAGIDGVFQQSRCQGRRLLSTKGGGRVKAQLEDTPPFEDALKKASIEPASSHTRRSDVSRLPNLLLRSEVKGRTPASSLSTSQALAVR